MSTGFAGRGRGQGEREYWQTYTKASKISRKFLRVFTSIIYIVGI